jgi:hypothetical protein
MGHQITKEEFNKALRETNAKPEEAIPGDGRQYYIGNQEGEDVVLLEDNTGPQRRYFQGPRAAF